MSFENIRARRDALARTENAVDPSTLTAGDEFYVIGFTTSDGVDVRRSGVFVGTTTVAHEKRFIVHIDGEPEASARTVAELGFFAPDSLAMLVVVRSLHDVTFDKDNRSDEARAEAEERARRA